MLAHDWSAHLVLELLLLLSALQLLFTAAADEQFNFAKQTGFKGDALAGIAVAFTQTTAVRHSRSSTSSSS